MGERAGGGVSGCGGCVRTRTSECALLPPLKNLDSRFNASAFLSVRQETRELRLPGNACTCKHGRHCTALRNARKTARRVAAFRAPGVTTTADPGHGARAQNTEATTVGQQTLLAPRRVA